MRVLVVGASGFIGSAIAIRLRARGDEVIGISRRRRTTGHARGYVALDISRQRDTGDWLPAGSILRHQSESAALPSGLDGLIYIPSHWRGDSLEAVLPDQRHCLIAALPATSADTELTCRLQI